MSGNPMEGLNPRQREAARNPRGPLMIVAGAGTGKTRTLTSRIAYLIQGLGAKPNTILAVTFTRRAANEMRERIAALLGGSAPPFPEVGTFHSVAAGILRQEIHHLGLDLDFFILTQEERIDLLREAGATGPAQAARSLEEISLFKNQHTKESGPPLLYAAYQAALRRRKGLDFDDLVPLTVRIFEEERRLFHVAMTRAMKELYLLRARKRSLFGKPLPGGPSSFLRDIEQRLYENEALAGPKRPRRPEDPQLGLF